MAENEMTKRLQAEVNRLARDVYASKGDAFAHVAVQEYFDLDFEDALEYCDVGGAHDKGIDAFWIDDEGRRAILVQAKWTQNQSKRFGATAVREVEAAYRWLGRVNAGKANSAAPRVIDAARRIAELRELEPEFPVHVYLIASSNFTKGATEEVARVDDDLHLEPVEFTLVPVDALLEQMEERASRYGEAVEAEPTFTFALTEGRYFEYLEDDEPPALVATLKGTDVAKAAQDWGYRLFVRNLRYRLPGQTTRGSVNSGIRRTLETESGRQRFWYYNNGIAIVCDSYEVNASGTAVTVNNMQVVNGAQTTTTLHDALEDLKKDPETSLIAKIIAEPDDDEFRQAITHYNNRQNAVKDRDLMSNDAVQDQLQIEFLQRKPPWFYERKRGEWNAVTAKDAGLRKRVGKRRIDNEKAAQAAYALYHDAARARADKKHLFQPKKDGGYYEDVFNENLATGALLLPFLLADYISSRKNEYLKQIRGIDRLRPTVAQKKLLSREWLKFGDQFILGTIGYYLELRGGLTDDRLEELLAGDFDGMTKGVYHAAFRDLHLLFTRKEREAAKAEVAFSPANYVKTHWDEALTHLDAEWDARESVGDPLEGVPMLSEDEFD